MKSGNKKLFARRPAWSHKGQYGYVFIVAGSSIHSGSPVFNALAALRSGADLAIVAGPERAMNIAASFAPDILTYPLDGELVLKHTPAILEQLERYHSLVIGCGLRRSEDTYRAIRRIVGESHKPIVIDAEAIRAIAKDKDILVDKSVILTPHAEEFRVLTGEVVMPDVKERVAKVKKWAGKLGAVILLKGHVDVVSDGKEVFLNKTGSPFMTKGGFGDALSGICGAFLARGIEPFRAACLAAYANGLAGERACRLYGEGVLASDIFQHLPDVINTIFQKKLDKGR